MAEFELFVKENPVDRCPAIVYPAQCECGHLYLEKYQFSTPAKDGSIGFCWCGFCRTRRNVFIKY
jgi:hypothetical protein